MYAELNVLKASDTNTNNEGSKHTEQNNMDESYVTEIEMDNKLSNNAKKEKEENDVEDDDNCCVKVSFRVQEFIVSNYGKHKQTLKTGLYILIMVLYFAYFTYALYYSFGDEPSVRLLVLTILIVFIILGKMLLRFRESSIKRFWKKEIIPCTRTTRWKKMKIVCPRFLKLAAMVIIGSYVTIDVFIEHPGNLVSLSGLVLFIALFYVTSINPAKECPIKLEPVTWIKRDPDDNRNCTHNRVPLVLALVNWHPVFWGLVLQFIFALLILRTRAGFVTFNWCGERVSEFLTYSDTGAKFVFGDVYAEHFIAFKVLPILIFFFTMMSVMYYLGAMQFIVRNIGRSLAFFMGTTPAESLTTAGNIFLGMMESTMMIQPLLADMTLSELHAVCTAGFASVAGANLGIYTNFGVPASHLLTASVLSAPAALAMSKLSYPEIEVSKASSKDYYRMGKAKERNILEAATNGATNSMKVIGLIAVNVIAVLSVLKFLNTTLTWLGQRAGIEELTFEFICSYLLYPFAFFMGVSAGDSRKIAALIGIKTFTNEFIAYQQLGVIIHNKQNFTDYTTAMNLTDWYYKGNDIILPMVNQTLLNGIVERKSEVIATYALLGFSNFGTIGIILGAVGGMIPERRSDLSRIVLRAMIAGNAACLMTGCIAGLFYKDYDS